MMSELVDAAVEAFLAEGRTSEVHAVLRKGSRSVAAELRLGWLPPGWTPEREELGDYVNRLIPDTPEAAECAIIDAERSDRATATWGELSADERTVIAHAAALLVDSVAVNPSESVLPFWAEDRRGSKKRPTSQRA